MFSLSKFHPHVYRPIAVCAIASIQLISTANTAVAQDRSIWLTNNSSATIRGYFLRGEDIFARCDEDCSDIDLFLYDDRGTLVDSDDAVDAFPIVTAPNDGMFVIEITMPACSHRTGCAAGISSDFGF
ncbi:MAG: hypothetical protein ACFB16_09990 [Phormidesmis sp.]